MAGPAAPARASRGTALGVVVLGVLAFVVIWIAWRFVAEGEQREAIHVFQYGLLLLGAAVAGALIVPASAYPLLALAAVTAILPWVGLDRPVLVAVLVAALAVLGLGYGLLRGERGASTAGGLGLVVSALGALLIL